MGKMGKNAPFLGGRTKRGRKGRKGVWRERENGTAIVGSGKGFRALKLELTFYFFFFHSFFFSKISY